MGGVCGQVNYSINIFDEKHETIHRIFSAENRCQQRRRDPPRQQRIRGAGRVHRLPLVFRVDRVADFRAALPCKPLIGRWSEERERTERWRDEETERQGDRERDRETEKGLRESPRGGAKFGPAVVGPCLSPRGESKLFFESLFF